MDQPVYETKKDYIARQIKKKILDGDFGPGARLKVRQLAAEFGTSEIPVREAIIELAGSGLVSIRPHVGATATPISSADLKNIFQIRSALERLATEAAATKMTASDLERIEKNADILRHAVDDSQDSDELTALNRAFHMSIYRCCGNERLVGMIEELWNHVGRYPGPLTGQDEATYQSIKEHAAIIEALRERDGALAAELTERHKDRSFAGILARVQQLEARIRAGQDDNASDEADLAGLET